MSNVPPARVSHEERIDYCERQITGIIGTLAAMSREIGAMGEHYKALDAASRQRLDMLESSVAQMLANNETQLTALDRTVELVDRLKGVVLEGKHW